MQPIDVTRSNAIESVDQPATPKSTEEVPQQIAVETEATMNFTEMAANLQKEKDQVGTRAHDVVADEEPKKKPRGAEKKTT